MVRMVPVCRTATAVLAAAACALLALLGQPCSIEFPRCGSPAMLAPGDPLTVEVRLPVPWPGPFVRAARLTAGESVHPLAVRGVSLRGSRAVLDCTVPAEVPPGAYGLRVGAGRGGAFRPNAVFLARQLPERFRFVHITDLGISAADPSVAARFRNTVDEINDLKPAFVLLSGDTCDRGRWSEYAAMYVLLLGIRAPVICCPGNHDRKGWAGYLTAMGRPYHATDFGRWRIVSLDTAHGRDQLTASQFRWLQRHCPSSAGGNSPDNSLAAAGDGGRNAWPPEPPSRPCLVQLHHPLFGRESVAARRLKTAGFLAGGGTAAVFSGHRHADAVYDREGRRREDAADFAGTKFVVTTAVGQSPRSAYGGGKDARRGYRVVYVADGRIVAYTHDDDGDGIPDPVRSTPLRAGDEDGPRGE